MKAITAVLLGLSTLSCSQDVDWERHHGPNHNGIIVQAMLQSDATPVVTLGSALDSYEDVYCLNFIGLFESADYNLSISQDAPFTEIEDTRIDLADANCSISEQSTSVFTILCNDVNGADLVLTFTFTQDAVQGDFGLEYTIDLEGYTLADADNKLVMVQSVKECSDLYDLEVASDIMADIAESTEQPEPEETEPTEIPEPTEPEEPEPTEGQNRRLAESIEIDEEVENDLDGELEDGEDEETDLESMEEADGISSDDSDEFDAGFARFVVHGQALDVCEDSEPVPIGSNLVYQSELDELHIVFDSFDCDLSLDPFYGLDESKYGVENTADPNGNVGGMEPTEDDGCMMSVVMAFVVNAVILALF